MKRYVMFFVVLGWIACQGNAHGGLFGKKNKPEPKDRVPELIAIVKTEQDEHKRASAANELRQFDPTAFPDIVPVLIEVLQNDAKTSVRTEAAESLGKMRPVSKQAGLALEQALDKDASMRVRMQARYSLLQYHWAGYRSASKEKDATITAESKEPPLAPLDGDRKSIAVSPLKKSQKVLKPTESAPPPLAPTEAPAAPKPFKTRKPSAPEKDDDGPRLEQED